ncbi:hypothetical protein PG994_013860 [Apiospora phragmitis]|uniref:Uncharacterized protein n=1 Tax=Apiospora phragmitis TaxID=2905665 RepID=A0ABR1T2N9_9PEZI
MSFMSFSLNKHETWDPVKESVRSLHAVAAQLQNLKHPFVMVGQAATFAMNVKWDDPTTVDLLVRASTLHKLKTVVCITGNWTEMGVRAAHRKGGASQRNIEPLRQDACVLFKRTVFWGGRECKSLRLWSEEAYGLKIKFDSFIQLKPTFQLFEKAELEDPTDEGSIVRYIPETYVPMGMDVDDRPFVLGTVHDADEYYDSMSYGSYDSDSSGFDADDDERPELDADGVRLLQQAETCQAYPMEQFVSRASQTDAAIRAWLETVQEERGLGFSVDQRCCVCWRFGSLSDTIWFGIWRRSYENDLC